MDQWQKINLYYLTNDLDKYSLKRKNLIIKNALNLLQFVTIASEMDIIQVKQEAGLK